MPKNRDFAPLDPLPANWTDSIEEFISQQAAGLRIIPKAGTNATVAQVPIPPGYAQVTVGMEGRWRWITSPVERAVPAGAARTLDAWLTASGNVFIPGTPGEIDATDPAFALVFVESGQEPVGGDLKRLVGRVVWDGSRIAAIDMLVGEAAGGARHAATHTTGGSDELTPAMIGAPTLAAFNAAVSSLGDAIAAETQARQTGDANNPSATQKAALAGTSGTPSDTNRYVTAADARLWTLIEATPQLVTPNHVAIGPYRNTTMGGANAAGVALVTAGRVQVARDTTNVVFSSELVGEALDRFRIQSSGELGWGNGTGWHDTLLQRLAAGILRSSTIVVGAGDTPANVAVKISTAGRIDAYSAAAADAIFVGAVKDDTVGRLAVSASGRMAWGDGTGARDVALARSAVGRLTVEGTLGVNVDLLVNGTHVMNGGASAITMRALASATQAVILSRASADTQDRFRLYGNGSLELGDGTNARDVLIARTAAGTLTLTGRLDTTGRVAVGTDLWAGGRQITNAGDGRVRTDALEYDPRTIPIVGPLTAGRLLSLGDAGKIIELNIASGASGSVTIPDDATVNFPVGTVIMVRRVGPGDSGVGRETGNVNYRAAGFTANTTLYIADQWGEMSLHKRAANDWIVTGGIR